MVSEQLKNIYKARRTDKRRAPEAIRMARENVAANKSVYSPMWHWARSSGLSRCEEANTKLTLKSRARFDGKCAWLEKPESIGLRFVDYSDKILKRLRHTGWFTDDSQDEKYRGAVWQLPARRGHAQYIAGFEAEPDWFLICLEPITDSDNEESKKQAARDGDWFAEKFAEQNREFTRVDAAICRVAEIVDSISELRKRALAACVEARTHRRMYGKSNLIHEVIRESVSRKIAEIRELRIKKQKIIDEYSSSPFWTAGL